MSNNSQEFLGSGLTIPLRRIGASGFLTATGVPLVRACIRQIIGTSQGELRWKPRFGTQLQRYKHKPNNEELEELISDDITTNLSNFEPRINKVDVKIKRQNSQIIASITWSVIDKNNVNNQVLLGPDTFEVTI